MGSSNNVLGAVRLVFAITILLGLPGDDCRPVGLRSRRVEPFVCLLIVILFVSFLQLFLVAAQLSESPDFPSAASTATYTLSSYRLVI